MTPSSSTWAEAIKRALSAHAEAPQAPFVQLATVGPGDLPACRTLVWRGWLELSELLQFTTDLRSAKVEQLQRLAVAEACWYFPTTREQFRLFGPIHLVGFDHPNPAWLQARLEVWRALPPETRLTFAGPAPGSAPRKARSVRALALDLSTPLATFGLLLLEPLQVDHLQVATSPHTRRIYSCDPGGTWTSRAVNP
jgi:PPOX class probable FMN-dependent enzyme